MLYNLGVREASGVISGTEYSCSTFIDFQISDSIDQAIKTEYQNSKCILDITQEDIKQYVPSEQIYRTTQVYVS